MTRLEDFQSSSKPDTDFENEAVVLLAEEEESARWLVLPGGRSGLTVETFRRSPKYKLVLLAKKELEAGLRQEGINGGIEVVFFRFFDKDNLPRGFGITVETRDADLHDEVELRSALVTARRMLASLSLDSEDDETQEANEQSFSLSVSRLVDLFTDRERPSEDVDIDLTLLVGKRSEVVVRFPVKAAPPVIEECEVWVEGMVLDNGYKNQKLKIQVLCGLDDNDAAQRQVVELLERKQITLSDLTSGQISQIHKWFSYAEENGLLEGHTGKGFRAELKTSLPTTSSKQILGTLLEVRPVPVQCSSANAQSMDFGEDLIAANESTEQVA